MTAESNTGMKSRESYLWSVFPMKESPAKGFLFWILIIIVIWAVYLNMESILFTLIAALILLGSMTMFWLPTQYSLDVEGVHVKRFLYRRIFPWDRVRSVYIGRNGIFLSPFPVRSRLENFRGLHLLSRDNNEAILEVISRYAPGARGLPQTKADDDSGATDDTTGKNGGSSGG